MKYIYELILENYARYTCLLQSPRLGKFVSNTNQQLCLKIKIKHGFNPLDRGNWYQINPLVEQYLHFFNQGFQSPRSGKFVSDSEWWSYRSCPKLSQCFNPLDRGNLYQICQILFKKHLKIQEKCFNPLDRGNLYQI